MVDVKNIEQFKELFDEQIRKLTQTNRTIEEYNNYFNLLLDWINDITVNIQKILDKGIISEADKTKLNKLIENLMELQVNINNTKDTYKSNLTELTERLGNVRRKVNLDTDIDANIQSLNQINGLRGDVDGAGEGAAGVGGGIIKRLMRNHKLKRTRKSRKHKKYKKSKSKRNHKKKRKYK